MSEISFVLCPVCGAPLTPGEHPSSSAWVCPAGHSFDAARQGYVNLLTDPHRHSKNPGDPREMIAARRAFLDAGHYRPIADKLGALLQEFCPGDARILDVGCGEGYYLARVGEMFPDAVRVGADVSKDAVRYAAARDKAAHFFTATATALPFAAGAFDAVLCMFAFTSPAEFARVLAPEGVFVRVSAGAEHLPALREIVYDEVRHKSPELPAEYAGFTHVKREEAEFAFSLTDPKDIRNLLAMTPHYKRIPRAGGARLMEQTKLCDRASVLFDVYRKSTEEKEITPE